MTRMGVPWAAAAVFAITGCAVPAERVQESIGQAVDRVELEMREHHDRQFRMWRRLRGLDDRYACLLSKGAIDRNATKQERAEIEAAECTK